MGRGRLICGRVHAGRVADLKLRVYLTCGASDGLGWHRPVRRVPACPVKRGVKWRGLWRLGFTLTMLRLKQSLRAETFQGSDSFTLTMQGCKRRNCGNSAVENHLAGERGEGSLRLSLIGGEDG